MEDFIVSARKYRPATFQSVIGQQSLVATLKNAIKSNHLAHAYLFCGPRGVGKTTCARIFAKTINCMNITAEFEACNECESCKSFNEQRSFNIHELDAASNNSVEDIRSLTDQVRIPPQIGKYSLYIIDEVHMLSTAAFNAFLKTLEEPPAHAIFILATTEKHKIIPTILSRCQIYDFNRIGINDTVKHLEYVAKQENVSVEPEALNVIAQKADGGMRDALSIFDQVVAFCGANVTYKAVIENLNVLDYAYYFRLVDAFLECKVPETLLIFNEILNKGFDAHHFLTGLAAHLRDVMVAKDAVTIQLLEVAESVADAYKQQAQKCELDFLYKGLKIANESDLEYRQSKNKRLLVEITLIRLCQLSDKKKNELDEDEQIIIAPIFSEIKVVPVSTAPAPKPVSAPPAPTKPSAPVTAKVSAKPTTSTEPAAPAFKSSSISISINAKPQQEAAVEQQTQVVQKRTNPFSEHQLHVAWREYIKLIPEKVRLANTMMTAMPVLGADNAFDVTVENSFQEEALNLEHAELFAFLSDKLQNDFLKMNIHLSEGTTTSVLLGKDKLTYMIQQNPAFQQFVTDFNLEIK